MNIYRSIPVSGGGVAWVDQRDYPMLSTWHWHHNLRGYAMRNVKRGAGWRPTFMHRFIMLPDPDQQVDHINGNHLDNRRDNLRLCTNAENHANLSIPANNTSGYKGVSKSRRRWRASIGQRGQCTHLGVFASAVDAALAYDLAAIRLFGEYARPNFLTTGTVA